MTSLYVIANEYQAMIERLENSELDAQTIADTIEGASGELEAKATNVAMYIRNLEATAEQIKLAEKAMADRRKAIESKADSIKQYLFDNMKRCGVSKIESPYFALTIKKNPPSVRVLEDSNIPQTYFVQPDTPPPQLDKRKLLEDLKAGIVIDGAELQQNERLEIK